MQSEDIEIKLTRENELFQQCAAMMAVSEPWLTLDMDYSYCLKAFDGTCKEVYVTMDESRIAGFVILQVCGSFKGYIQTLFVNNEWRGKGIGKKILQFCEQRVLQISPNLFICVSSFNERAIKLYKEFGFEHVGMLRNFVKEGFDELLMRKTFGPVAGYTAHDTKS